MFFLSLNAPFLMCIFLFLKLRCILIFLDQEYFYVPGNELHFYTPQQGVFEYSYNWATFLTLSFPTPRLLCVSWGGGWIPPPSISPPLIGLGGWFFSTMCIYPKSINKREFWKLLKKWSLGRKKCFRGIFLAKISRKICFWDSELIFEH